MKTPNPLAALLLCATAAAILTVTAVSPTAGGPAEDKTAAQKAVQPQLEVFADRVTLKVGEEINVTIWVKSDVTDSVVVQPLYAAQQMQLVGEAQRPVALPQAIPLTLTFKGISAGKSNLLVRATSVSRDKGEPLVATQKISGIEVQEQSYSLKSVLSNSLFGAFFGAILTFVVTSLNDRRQRGRDSAQRKLWLSSTLPTLLETHRLEVSKSQKVNPSAWQEKMMTEGMYKDLHALALKAPGSETLVDDLIEAGSLLREYERVRAMELLEPAITRPINDRLVDVIKKLRAL